MQSHDVVFKSVATEKRIVWAEVYAPDRPDSDKEFMRADQIEAMAYNFMKSMKLDAVDHQHDQVERDNCYVVESFIARKGDPDFIEGAWVVGMYVGDDEMWEKVKKGEINGFSMEALVRKNPTEVEVELPPVLSGRTMKSEDHDHEFLVAYNDNGDFLGGRTTPAQDGHYHVIKRGTITETTNGHNHRFSHVDQLQIL